MVRGADNFAGSSDWLQQALIQEMWMESLGLGPDGSPLVPQIGQNQPNQPFQPLGFSGTDGFNIGGTGFDPRNLQAVADSFGDPQLSAYARQLQQLVAQSDGGLNPGGLPGLGPAGAFRPDWWNSMNGLDGQPWATGRNLGSIDGLDALPGTKKELIQAIKDKLEEFKKSGNPMEARPGSKIGNALQTGDFSKLSTQELMQLLIMMLTEDPNALSKQADSPIARQGSWSPNYGSGTASPYRNDSGGGTQYTGANANASVMPGSGKATANANIPHYAQSDPAWSGQTLGNGGGTIGSAGCLLTSMTMVSDKLTGKNLNPSQANQIAAAAGGFVSGGDSMIQPKTAAALGIKMTGQMNVSQTGALDRVDQELAAGRPVILGVNATNGEPGHWIVVTGKNPDGTYNGVDSATGQDIKYDNKLNCISGSHYTPAIVEFFDKA